MKIRSLMNVNDIERSMTFLQTLMNVNDKSKAMNFCSSVLIYYSEKSFLYSRKNLYIVGKNFSLVPVAFCDRKNF